MRKKTNCRQIWQNNLRNFNMYYLYFDNNIGLKNKMGNTMDDDEVDMKKKSETSNEAWWRRRRRRRSSRRRSSGFDRPRRIC